jgi:hypothetical protein
LDPAQQGAAARHQVAAQRELVHEGARQACRGRLLPGKAEEQLPEALDGELGLAELLAPVALPERLVDRAEVAEDAERPGQATGQQGRAQRRPLGPVEIEKRLVGVEENGAKPRQGGTTWRGR